MKRSNDRPANLEELCKQISVTEKNSEYSPGGAERLREALQSQKFTENERNVIFKYYEDGKNFTEIAKELGISTTRTIDMERKALYKIKRDYKLREYLRTGERDSKVTPEDSVEYLGLSNRASYGLIRGGIPTIAKLCSYSLKELSQIRGMGKSTLAEIEGGLAVHGFALKS